MALLKGNRGQNPLRTSFRHMLQNTAATGSYYVGTQPDYYCLYRKHGQSSSATKKKEDDVTLTVTKLILHGWDDNLPAKFQKAIV